MNSEINPYAPPPRVDAPSDQNAPPEMRRPRRERLALGTAAVALSVCVIATVAAAIDIESIIVSGAFLSLLSVFLLVMSRQAQMPVFTLLAYIILFTSLGCFLTINYFEWSPRQAHAPIGVAIAIVTLGLQWFWLPLVRLAKTPQDAAE